MSFDFGQLIGQIRSIPDRVQELILKYLRPIIYLLGFISVIFFIAWLWTMLVLPAEDAQRARKVVSLPNGSTLVADFPRRFPADDQSLPVYLTTDTSEPLSVTIELSNDLPLVLMSVEPRFAAKMDDTKIGHLVVTWPITTPINMLPQSTMITGTSGITSSLASTASITPKNKTIIPMIAQPNTVGLFFKNARFERGWPPFFGLKGASLTILTPGKDGNLDVEIETTDRAYWRLFAMEYSFIVILPFLVAAFGYLGKAYTDRQKAQREAATFSLEAFKEAMIAGHLDKAAAQYEFLRQSSKHLSKDDWERTQKIWIISEGRTSVKGISADEFSTWSDVWASALVRATEISLKRTEDPQLGSPRTESDTSYNEQSIRQFVRVFPRYLLSLSVEKRFRKLPEELRLRPTQRHGWPMPAGSPQSYAKTNKSSTIREMGLFAFQNARSEVEQGFLFSEDTEWFWREHPLYRQLSTTQMSTFVYGKPGTGKTALALGLTKYAHRDEQRGVLASYHHGSTPLVDVQMGLAQALLGFARWRSTWLMTLEREDRDLLASLWLSVIDANYLLAQLSSPEYRQFEEATTPDQKSLWEEQSLLELQLMRQSVERMATERPMTAGPWFLALSHCARQLEFRHLRVALDMSAQDWDDWREARLRKFIRIIKGDGDLPLQLILMVSSTRDLPLEKPDEFTLAELRWDCTVGVNESTDECLSAMFKHRAVQRGMKEDSLRGKLPGFNELVAAALANPRRLASLWLQIDRVSPDATEVTANMVAEAQNVLEKTI